MKINLRESLNELDMLSDNRYDLYNTYLAKNPSIETKKKMVKAIYENKSPREIALILKEDWDDAAWHDTADQEQVDQPDYFPDGEEEPEWEEMNSKSVRDSDGFLTDYTWYRKNDNGKDHHVFVFGDNDLYGPEDGYFDWECDSLEEAEEWFENYEGPGDEDDDWMDESLKEDMVKVEPTEKELNQVINVLTKYGFKVDDNYKPGRGLFGSYHIQVINPDLDYIDFDQLVKDVEPIGDALDNLSFDINMPITYNFGANDDNVITGGIDIHVGYRDDDISEDLNLDDFMEPVDQVGKAKIYYDSNKRTYFIPSLDLDFETLDQAKDFIGAPLYMGESLEEEYESLNEASYGGAFDIEDDMFFTRDDINEFAWEVADSLSSEFGRTFDISDVYMETPKRLHLEVTDGDYDYFASIDIDMRKIKAPQDLMKYFNDVINQIKAQFV